MAEVEFETNKNGRQKRVYFTSKVHNTSPLVKAQQQLSERLPGFKPIPADNLHLTLFYYGTPYELFTDVFKLRQNVFASRFKQAFSDHLVEAVDAVGKKNGEFYTGTDGLDWFGPDLSLIALKLRPGSTLTGTIRGPISYCLYGFLDKFGIKDTNNFMRQSPNLSFQCPYLPHVTLGSVSDNKIDIKTLPGVGATHLCLGPATLTHARVVRD